MVRESSGLELSWWVKSLKYDIGVWIEFDLDSTKCLSWRLDWDDIGICWVDTFESDKSWYARQKGTSLYFV